MPSPESVYEDMEADRSSRESEIRLIERFVQSSEVEVDRSMLKRSLILLAYAHLEGFCKFALLSYTGALNALQLKCGEASYPVAAASLSRIFAALRDPQSKHPVFRNRMPSDAQLHLSAREQIFLESYDTVTAGQLDIPDRVVDTKSNLSPDVLKKMLFQLGLNYPVVDEHRSNIAKLLGIRNAIAHGDRLKVPSDVEITEYLATVFAVMSFMQTEIYDALRGQMYLRRPVVLDENAEAV
jgi:hypothetical protein